MEVGVIGKKCDLYPPKTIREELGLKPGQKVIYRTEKEKLVIEIIPDVIEAEKLPKFAETTVEGFEKFTKEFQKVSAERVETELKMSKTRK